jgi:polyisoprenoid-binding protein YceI
MKTKNHALIFLLSTALFVSCKSDVKKTEPAVKQNEKTPMTTENVVSTEGVYSVDNNASKVSWKGSKLAGTHFGEIKIKSGEMKFKDGEMTAAKFTADMTSINVMDLEGGEKLDLESHLKGKIEGKEDHFFNVEKFPESHFSLKSIKTQEKGYKLYGELTIKGISNPVEFDSTLKFDNENKTVKLITEEFEIDRTKWGIEFLSKSVFDDLKENFINDEIKLKVELKAIKAS